MNLDYLEIYKEMKKHPNPLIEFWFNKYAKRVPNKKSGEP